MAAATAGATAATVLALSDAPAALELAAGAAVAVLLVPRLGWLVAVAAMVGWLALGAPGVPGAALVVAAALVPTALLVPRAGTLWPLPALAAAAGVLGVGPVYLALAARAATAWRRAALAIGGAVAILAAEVLRADEEIPGVRAAEAVELLPDPPGAGWEASATAALDEVLIPLAGGVGTALALAWAALAVALPLLVRGTARTRAAGALAWAAGALVAHAAVAELAGVEVPTSAAAGAVAGVAIAALVGATAPSGARSSPRSARQSRSRMGP